MYKMTVKGLAEGRELVIDGLGAFANGTYDISTRDAEQFRIRQSSHNPKPPTLLEAFKGHPNIEVTTSVADKPKSKSNDSKGGDE